MRLGIRSRKLGLLLGCALSALVATEAFAEDASKTSTLDEVIVTAERRVENAQDTPISITAFNSQSLEKLGIFTASDLSHASPGFSYREDSSLPGYPDFTFRGFTQSGFFTQPSVAVYIDGVYGSISAGSVLTGGFFDVSNIEVLKGPQGTLFGRNSIGGAINITTNLPTDHFEAKVLGEAGSSGKDEVSGMINVPLADGLALRLVAQQRHLDGYGYNLTTGQELNEFTEDDVRGTLKYDTGKFEAVLRGQYSTNLGSGVGPHLVELTSPVSLPTGLPVRQAAIQLGFAPNAAGLNAANELQAYNALLALNPSDPRDTRSPAGFVGDQKHRDSTGDLTLSYQLLDHLQLKSITGFRSDTLEQVYDDYGVPVVIIQLNPTVFATKQVSEELQLNGDAWDGRVKFAAGAFYYHSSEHSQYHGIVAPLVNPGNPSNTNATFLDDNEALYAQSTIVLTSNLNAVVGIRYTHEDVEDDDRGFKGGVCQVPTVFLVPGEPCLGIFKTDFTNTSWTGGLNYKFEPDAMIYGKVSTGFKAGGENNGSPTNVLTFGAYAPEKVTSYEVGEKSEFLDHRLRINLAVYDAEYTNIQRSTNFFDPVTGASGGRTGNAASGRVQGAEFEVTARPVEALDINLGASYVDARYLN